MAHRLREVILYSFWLVVDVFHVQRSAIMNHVKDVFRGAFILGLCMFVMGSYMNGDAFQLALDFAGFIKGWIG